MFRSTLASFGGVAVVAVLLAAANDSNSDQQPSLTAFNDRGPKPYDGHPRLFFNGPADKNRLLVNMSPQRKKIWDNVLQIVKPTVTGSSGRKFGRNLAATALVFGISGAKNYREGALAGLRKAMDEPKLC